MHIKTAIYNAKIITPYRVLPENYVVDVKGNKISDITTIDLLNLDEYDNVIDANGLFLTAGFIDTHTHGAGNSDFMDGSVDAVVNACRTHMQYGTTSIVPTTLSGHIDELLENLGNIEKAMEVSENMPNILGIHMEGPYFSSEQNGAQDAKYVKNIDYEEIEYILSKHSSIVKWSIAPELPGALELGRSLNDKGVVVSIGHSNGVYEDVINAIENGYSMVTHLFNGMSRLTRKNALMYLGVAESTLLCNELTAEIIADGKHLPIPLLQLIYKCKGAEHICLVTDSMRAAGVNTKESIIGSLKRGQRVEIEDGVAYMPNRKSFGGSVCTADRLVRTMYHQAGIPLNKAIEMITLTPAKTLGIQDRKGSIGIGKDADLVLFDDDINIKLVMVMGKIWKNLMK